MYNNSVTAFKAGSATTRMSSMEDAQAKVLSQGFSNYAQQTSLHGWQYIDIEPGWFRKTFWAIVVLGSLVLSIIVSVIGVQEYIHSGTVTSINTTTASLSDITFPSMILCNVNQVTASFLWKLDIQAEDDQKKKLLFETFLDGVPGNKEAHDDENNATLNELYKTMEEKLGWSKEQPFYKIASQNCSDMILEADWKSDSPKYFFPSYKSATDYGACCLITPYLDFVLSNDSKTIADGSYVYTGADYHAIPKGLTRNGIQNGLKIILDVENYDYAYFPRGAKGFRAVVGDSRDKAVINQNGFYIAAGTETLSAMTLTVLNTTEDALTAFDPLKRDCYTETEFYFKYMNWADGFRYSMQNCLYESVLEHIIDHCKCVPAFANFKLNIEPMPSVCRGKDLTCAKQWMDNFGNPDTTIGGVSYDLTIADTNETIFGIPINQTCKQRCESQEQTLMSTSSSYPNRQTFPYREDFCLIMKKVARRVCKDDQRKKAFENRYKDSITCQEILNAHEGVAKMCQKEFPETDDVKNNKKIVDFIHEYSEANIAVVKLFIRDPYYTNIKRDRAMTFVNFLGNAGGLVGLCMGFSLISAIEWVYHFFNFIVKTCGICNRTKK